MRRRAQDWPVPDQRETVVTGGPPGPPPPGRRSWFDDNLALGLGAILVLLILIGGAAVGIYVARHSHHHNASTVRTVLVTTTSPAQTVTTAAKTATTPPAATKTAVPSFVGEPIAQARATVTSMHFRLATTPVTGAGQPAGTVVDQAPKAGKKLASGGLVTLSVAKGSSTTTTATTTAAPPPPKTATVPDVSGQVEQPAVQAFAQAGVLPSLVFVSSSDPEGTVEAQAKTGGTTVAYRSHVQLNISSGQSPTMEHMPNVVGMTLQQALASINAAHLKMIYVKLPVPRSQAGKIVQQSPLPGGAAPENAQVLVFLGVFKP